MVLSTKNHNPEGLREKDLRARDRDAACIGRKYKKRNLSELSSDDVAQILNSYLVDHQSQKEVARKFRVSAALVSRLVCRGKKEPNKLRELK